MPGTSAPGGAGDGVGNDWAGHLPEKGVFHGLFGEELFHGQLVTGNFVPEQHTDFILTVAGGGTRLRPAPVAITVLGIVIVRALLIAAHADDQFGLRSPGESRSGLPSSRSSTSA